jgi:hypothetical protein
VRGKHYHFGLDWSRADGAGHHLHPTKDSVLRTLTLLETGEIKAGTNVRQLSEKDIDATSLVFFPFAFGSCDDDGNRWGDLLLKYHV